jgi:hypothetical protein
VRLDGLGQLKNPVTSSGIEPATFRLVALSLNQLRYRVPYKHIMATSEFVVITKFHVDAGRTRRAEHVVRTRNTYISLFRGPT